MLQTDSYTLYLGDCLDVMAGLEPRSVDAIICDPPFGTTANRWDSVIPLDAMWTALKRVTKPNAAIVLFGVQPFTSLLVSSNLKCYKHRWVWNKRSAGNFAVAKHMPLTIDEDIVVFTPKGERANYYPIMTEGKSHKRGWHGGTAGQGFGGIELTFSESNQFYPKSILEFPVVPRATSQHPSQKPVALMEYLIRTYTNEGETVLDFTMGSGSTGVAALNTGRKFIGIERDADYYAIAVQRLNAAQQAPQQLQMEAA